MRDNEGFVGFSPRVPSHSQTMSVTILTDLSLNQFQRLNIQRTICHAQHSVSFLKCDLVRVHTPPGSATHCAASATVLRARRKAEMEGDGQRGAASQRPACVHLYTDASRNTSRLEERRFTLEDISRQQVPSYFLNNAVCARTYGVVCLCCSGASLNTVW